MQNKPYLRPVLPELLGKGQGISIAALPAGHMIGGSIWKISKVGEQDIYYAAEYNNKKERHLNGSELEKVPKPGILITNGFNALHMQEKRRKRDDLLLSKTILDIQTVESFA